MGNEGFEHEVLQRLTRIEARQESTSKQCIVCQPKIDRLEIQVAHLESALQSAQERLNVMQVDRNELKKDLTDAIKEQISGIYRMAAVLGWQCLLKLSKSMVGELKCRVLSVVAPGCVLSCPVIWKLIGPSERLRL